ncbi:OmpA family protein [Marinibacterium profundimaris]|uniref:cell envelope biogenesis protein OmpA n=1 Tax=Marinibacterium profundimaris TaxID=1679460 RepID=UPI000B52257F|nr:cell envelope biogenesis protein OmpA [Marinibacterium profundimaris]
MNPPRTPRSALRRCLPAALAVWLAAGPALAFEPDIAFTTRPLSERVSEAAHALPTGPWTPDGMETLTITGTITRRTWRVDEGPSSQQIIDPLIAQAEAEGYVPVYSCQDRVCGGFDFRFAIDVVPAPDMFVDLADYRYVSAMNADGDALALLVSAGRGGAWLQVTEVTRTAPVSAEDQARTLIETGRLVLDTITPAASETPIPALDVLSSVLKQRPDVRLAIVAHSATPDAGDTATDMAEAEALRMRLIDDHGVDPARVEAHSLGALAPRAAPLDPAARSLNRRIEAVLLAPPGPLRPPERPENP